MEKGDSVFAYMYLIGLLIGLACYSLTYLFSKTISNPKRVIIVAIIGAVFLFGSIFVIGGFEGMPFGVLSIGIFTVSILLAFLGRFPIWTKTVYVVIILTFVFIVSADYLNKVDYWVIKKRDFEGEIITYAEGLQNDPTIRGYRTFTISEGDPGIVLSLGDQMAGNNIEVLDVKEDGGTTVIQIRTFYNQSPDKNPYIMIGLNRLKQDVIIMDTDGTIYENIIQARSE